MSARDRLAALLNSRATVVEHFMAIITDGHKRTAMEDLREVLGLPLPWPPKEGDLVTDIYRGGRGRVVLAGMRVGVDRWTGSTPPRTDRRKPAVADTDCRVLYQARPLRVYRHPEDTTWPWRLATPTFPEGLPFPRFHEAITCAGLLAAGAEGSSQTLVLLMGGAARVLRSGASL